MALPASYKSIHEQYKDDTRGYMDWLTNAARVCSIRLPESRATSSSNVVPTAGGRLKGKARKQNRQAGGRARYPVTASESLRIARALSTSSKTESLIPGGIRFILRRAINCRRKSNGMFILNGADADSIQDHEAFINILQESHDLLSRRVQVAGTEVSANVLGQDRHCNQFQILGIEDTEQDDDLPRADVENRLYELAPPNSRIEEAFAGFCFLEDLHAVQDQVKQAWHRFVEGVVSLGVVSVVTQAAINIAQRLIQQALQRSARASLYPEHNTYDQLIMPLLVTDANKRGANYEEMAAEVDGMERQEIHDFVYLSTFQTLAKFNDYKDYAPGLPRYWPAVVPSPRYTYIARPDLRNQPAYLKREKDDERLIQMLLDVMLFEHSKDPRKGTRTQHIHPLGPLRDEFSRCAANILETSIVGMNAVFISQLMLDLCDISEAESMPAFLPALLQYGHAVQQSVDGVALLTEGGLEKSRSWTLPLKADLQQLRDLITSEIVDSNVVALKNFWQRYVLQLPEAPKLEEVFRDLSLKRLEEYGISEEEASRTENAWMLDLFQIPASDRMHLDNPLQGSALMLALALKQEDVGIGLANEHMAIFLAAHLYNTFRQMELTTLVWPEMEQVIELQKNPIFANDIPSTRADIVDRLRYRGGLAHKHSHMLKRHSWRLRPNPLSGILLQLLEGRNASDKLIHDLVTILAKADESRRHFRRQRSPADILTFIGQNLSPAIEAIKFDYIKLAIESSAMLRSVRVAVQQRIGYVCEPDESSLGITNGWFLLTLLDQAREVYECHEVRKDPKPHKPYTPMRIACKVFEQWYAEKDARPLPEAHEDQHESGLESCNISEIATAESTA